MQAVTSLTKARHDGKLSTTNHTVREAIPCVAHYWLCSPSSASCTLFVFLGLDVVASLLLVRGATLYPATPLPAVLPFLPLLFHPSGCLRFAVQSALSRSLFCNLQHWMPVSPLLQPVSGCASLSCYAARYCVRVLDRWSAICASLSRCSAPPRPHFLRWSPAPLVPSSSPFGLPPRLPTAP